VDLPYRHHFSTDLAAANLDIEALVLQNCLDLPHPPVFVAYQLCPPRLRQLVEDTTTMILALRTPERLHRSLNLVPSLASEPEDSPEPQVQLPASTTPARIEEGEEGAQKRRHKANQLYPSSRYEP
jgi:hypothetical protein